MVKVLIVLGLALLGGGVYAVIDGWPYLVIERGFTQVIVGAVGIVGGLLMLAQACILAELRRSAAVVANAMKAVAATALAGGEATPGLRPGALFAGGAAAGAALAVPVRDVTEPPDTEIAALSERQPELPFPELTFAAQGAAAAATPAAEHRPFPEGETGEADEDAIPPVRAVQPEDSVERNDPDALDDLRADLLIDPADRILPPSGTGIASLGPETVADRVSDALKPAIGPVQAGPPGGEDSEGGTEPSASEGAPVQDEAVATGADDADPDDVAGAPKPPAASEEGVIGAYQVGDAHFTMYSDGSIKAVTPDGDYTFGSMDELKAYLASEKSKLEV